jgi:hypothetical protein
MVTARENSGSLFDIFEKQDARTEFVRTRKKVLIDYKPVEPTVSVQIFTSYYDYTRVIFSNRPSEENAQEY